MAGVAPCATHRPATHEACAPQSLSCAHIRGGGTHDGATRDNVVTASQRIMVRAVGTLE